MNIKGIGPSKVINLYSQNKRVESKEIKELKNVQKDSVQISTEGRSLSSLSIEDNLENRSKRIEEIKEAIEKGTYKPSSKEIAKKIIEAIKGEKSNE
jgi:negative regulator of flagellin synthesis FlgM